MTATPEMIRKRKRCAGTSLIEAVTALAIFGGCLGGACHLGLHTKMLSDQARAHYQAVCIAKSRMERIRVMPFEQLDYCIEDAVRCDQSGVADGAGRFRRTTTVAEVGTDLKEVLVKVEMLNRVTLAFDGEAEEIASCIARFRTEV